MSKTTFNERDLDFIVTALNAHWYDAHHNLERKDLGDIERKNYETQLLRSKELMESITNDSQLHPSPTPDVTEAVEFAEWIADPINPFIALENNRWAQSSGNSTTWTTQQLYSLFKNQKQ